jgi:hypothetical protein
MRVSRGPFTLADYERKQFREQFLVLVVTLGATIFGGLISLVL